MKVITGMFYLECNTFNPELVTKEKFIVSTGDTALTYQIGRASCRERVSS